MANSSFPHLTLENQNSLPTFTGQLIYLRFPVVLHSHLCDFLPFWALEHWNWGALALVVSSSSAPFSQRPNAQYWLLLRRRHTAIPDIPMPFPLTALLLPDDQILPRIKDLTSLALQSILPDLNGGIALNVQLDGLKRT